MQKKFSRSFDELKEIVAFTDTFFGQEDIDPSLRYLVDLCVEELFVNMVTYDTETQEDILLEMYPHERGVEVSLTDFDVERFDPREGPDVDVDPTLEALAAGADVEAQGARGQVAPWRRGGHHLEERV